MSTETTNKKIKIDNGTTFGRTYTDKAVDELLKNAGGGGTSVIELTDKNGTIASAQLGKINANPQNFAFKYSGKILLFTRSSSTTYQYCNNTTNSSDNNVMTTSTLLTIESSTGVYTITENAHNVVANSIHPANGGDLTNIQVGSKVYSIPSGGGSGSSLKVFEPTITGVSIIIKDETKTLSIVFNASNSEIKTYLNTLIENNKPFTETLYLKTPVAAEYNAGMMINTTLSLINTSTDISNICHCFYVMPSGTINIKGIVYYNEDIITLGLTLSDEQSYAGFKQLTSLIFTTDTKIKITIKTDE